jgi:hypothetical protein
MLEAVLSRKNKQRFAPLRGFFGHFTTIIAVFFSPTG